MTVAFLGLGTMGYRMAGRLASAGVEVSVYNRSPGPMARWCAEYGREGRSTPAAAVEGASVVLACLSDDQAVREVTRGPQGAFSQMLKGSVFVDHSTGSAALAVELAAAAREMGVAFLDAPVTGGKPGASKGTLTTMVGGEAEALALARPYIAHYAQHVFHLGSSGAGQVAKMANQICIAGIVQSLAEALALAERAGLDPESVLNVLRTGSARSWQMENRGPNMLSGKYDFGFSAEWLAKDLKICMDQGQKTGLAMDATQVASQALQRLVERGFKHEDVGALMRLYRP